MSSGAQTEPKAALDTYARFYGPLALASVVLLFMPILNDDVVETDHGSTLARSFGTLWEIGGRNGGGGAQLGIFLIVVFAVLAVIATFRPRSGGVPTGIAVVSTLIVVLLIFAPRLENDPAPSLSTPGVAGLVLAISATVVGIVHAVHCYTLRVRQKQRLNALYGARIRRSS